MNPRSTLLTALAAVFFTLGLSGVAAAQRNDPWWNGQRDGDYRNQRGGYGRYDGRTLRDAAQRIKDRSHDFERDVDRALDRSRVDGTRREDRINDSVHDFRRAADRFRDRVGNGNNDIYRSQSEASELLSRANQIDRVISRLRLDSRAYSDWTSMSQDLRLVADIYGLRYNGGYGNDGYYDPRYPNDNRRTRRSTNDDWWRRLPNVIRP